MINVLQEKIKLMEKVGHINKALDIGCGNGFMSDYFLKKDAYVVGIDSKNKPLIKDPRFTFINKDIRDYNFNEEFDLIICSLFLHFFKDHGAKFLIENIKEFTGAGGYNLLICISNDDNLSKQNLSNFFPTIDELKGIYSEWELIDINKGETEKENHGTLGEHPHNLIFSLFKKPLSS